MAEKSLHSSATGPWRYPLRDRPKDKENVLVELGNGAHRVYTFHEEGGRGGWWGGGSIHPLGYVKKWARINPDPSE